MTWPPIIGKLEKNQKLLILLKKALNLVRAEWMSLEYSWLKEQRKQEIVIHIWNIIFSRKQTALLYLHIKKSKKNAKKKSGKNMNQNCLR